MNWAQKELYESLHNFEVVLKCRQIGITTFFVILLLDNVLWNDNVAAAIIAHTLDDSANIFQDKLKYAFDHLHPALRPLFKVVGDSAKELAFKHGSVIRVGTSMRGSTLNYLHISEFGKICAKNPEKAREVVTGSLQTVHVGQSVYIESTAEGQEGYFFDLCQQAMEQKKSAKPLGPLDFYFHFFPWFRDSSYCLVPDPTVKYDDYLNDYFAASTNKGIKLSEGQKLWYSKKYALLKEDMLREFPSTPEEAFQASQEGYWYARQMKDLADEGHITHVSYDKALPVHTAWDLGQADFMAIWFFQVTRSGEINFIDYFEHRDTPIDQIAAILKSKNYSYGSHIWPHDANARDRAGITFAQQAMEFGLTGIILEQHNLRDGINLVRSTLSKCWFDAKKCHKGVVCLQNYKKKWSSSIGGFTGEVEHDEYSHGSDAFRYACAGISRVDDGKHNVEKDMKAIRSYYGL